MSTKKAPTKAEQAKLDAEKAEAEAKAKSEEEAQAKADADAKAEAEKAEQAKLDAEKAEAEKAKTATNTSGKTYSAQWTLNHDNKRYVAGDKLTLSDDEAEALVDAGVLVAVK